MSKTYHTGNCGLAPEPVYLTPAEAAMLAGLRDGSLVVVTANWLKGLASRCPAILANSQEEPRDD